MESDESFFEENKPKLFALGMLLLVGFYFIFIYEYKDNEIYFRYKLNDEQYKGIVIKQYIDKKNRDAEVIIIKDSINEIELNTYDWINFFDSCNIGDTVIKNKGANELLVIKSKNNDSFNWINFFDSSNIDDTVEKNKDANELMIIKSKNKDSLFFKYDRKGSFGEQTYHILN